MFCIKVSRTLSNTRLSYLYELSGFYATPLLKCEGYVTEYDPNQLGTVDEAQVFETEDEANNWIEAQYETGIYNIDDDAILEVEEISNSGLGF